MEIDPFTFTAQIVNFLILVALLKKVLYGPILSIVEAREQSLEQQQQALLEQAQKNVSLREELEDQLAQGQAHKAEELSALRREIEIEKERLLVQVRADAEEQRSHWRRSLVQQSEHLGQELSRKLSDSVLGVTRQALKDLAGQELEAAAVRAFLAREDGLLEGPHTVITSFELSPELRQDILAHWPGASFTKDAEGVFGIEVRGSREKLSWNIDTYLQARKEELSRLLEKETHHGAA